MLEATRIRKEGYSHRPTFADFVDRYKLIGFPLTSDPGPSIASCQRICEKAAIKAAEEAEAAFDRVFKERQAPEDVADVIAYLKTFPAKS